MPVNLCFRVSPELQAYPHKYTHYNLFWGKLYHWYMQCHVITIPQCKKGSYFFSQPLEIKSGPLQVQTPRMRANVLCMFLSRFLKEAQLCGVWWRLYITLHSLVCPSSCVSNGCKYGRKTVNYRVSFLGCQREPLWVGWLLWPVTYETKFLTNPVAILAWCWSQFLWLRTFSLTL